MDTEQIPQFSEEELKNITDFFTLLVELDHKYFPENSE